MLEYWLLFAYPAILAMAYPAAAARGSGGTGQKVAMTGFILFYTVLGGLREEVGGDWINYIEIYDSIRGASLSEALDLTDPLYGLVNWISVQFNGDIYVSNTVCCFILATGVARVARTFRDPWLAITMAVPYLLIVVGLGYVRQGASIGMMLIALASLDRAQPLRTLFYLVLGVGFHSTAVVAFPLFVFAFTRRNRAGALVVSVLAAVLFLTFLAPRIAKFEANYFEAEYDSEGALVRVLMGLLPALLILLRWRHFPASDRVRSVWLMIALANVLAFAGLFVSASSTAIDRVALFVSVIQLAAFGEIRAISGTRDAMTPFLRILLIGVAAAVQTVWLVLATYAFAWVPYNAIFYAQ